MNQLTDMITNFGAVAVGCIVLKFWGFRKPAGVAVMLFSLFEVVIHVSIGIRDMNTFAPYGMNTLYSPCLITSLFGFLLIAIGLAIHLFKKKRKPPEIYPMGYGNRLNSHFRLFAHKPAGSNTGQKR